MLLVTCKNCGWVHMGVSREYAEEQVKKFNEFYVTLPPESQELYYNNKPASIDEYLACMRCGAEWSKFRRFEDGDCPDGCTIGPIVQNFEEEGVPMIIEPEDKPVA